MPTLEHNGLIEMFRENPSLVPRLLARLFGINVPAHASVRVADSSLDQLIPVEFRADLVLELRDDKDAVVLAIVLEAQRQVSARKKFSWPVYVAVTRAERECPSVVLVIAIDAEIAAWAGEAIDLGLGLGRIQPLVLGPATLPVVTDPAVAEKEVELAVLSAMAHGNGPQGLAVLEAAFAALGRLDHEHAASSGMCCVSLCGGLWRQSLWRGRLKARRRSPRSRSSSSTAASLRGSGRAS